MKIASRIPRSNPAFCAAVLEAACERASDARPVAREQEIYRAGAAILNCCGARIRGRLKAGWTREMAEKLPKQKQGKKVCPSDAAFR